MSKKLAISKAAETKRNGRTANSGVAASPWSAMRLLRFGVAFGLALFGVALLTDSVRVNAAACAAPSTDLGTDEITMDVPATGTYTVWTRMKAPDTSHNAINLQIDGTSCYSVGGGSFTATSWASGSGNWIKYQNGTPSSVISLQLTQGSHKFKYIGTQAGVEIDRIIISSDASCTPTGTGDNCQSGDSTPPTVSLTAPTAGQAVTGTISLKAVANDASGIDNVQFLVDGNPINTDTDSPYEYAWNSAAVANGQHSISARATDSANNTATSAPITVNISNANPCSAAPSVPSGVKAAGATSAVAVSWAASTPANNCTIQGYKVYRNGTLIASPTSTKYNDTGLTPGATYSYTVAAYDTSGHTSAQSAAVSATTTADTTAPGAPGMPESTLRTATSVALTWPASTDNIAVKEYVIYRNGTEVGTSDTNSFTDKALAPSTTYKFTVKARDLADNMSPSSPEFTVTTLSGSGANKGDLNGNGKVDIADLSILLSHWGQTGVPVTQGDVNGSGKVELTDLSILLSNWGKSI